MKLTIWIVAITLISMIAGEIANAQMRTCTSTYNPYTRTTTTTCY